MTIPRNSFPELASHTLYMLQQPQAPNAATLQKIQEYIQTHLHIISNNLEYYKKGVFISASWMSACVVFASLPNSKTSASSFVHNYLPSQSVRILLACTGISIALAFLEHFYKRTRETKQLHNTVSQFHTQLLALNSNPSLSQTFIDNWKQFYPPCRSLELQNTPNPLSTDGITPQDTLPNNRSSTSSDSLNYEEFDPEIADIMSQPTPLREGSVSTDSSDYEGSGPIELACNILSSNQSLSKVARIVYECSQEPLSSEDSEEDDTNEAELLLLFSNASISEEHNTTNKN